MPERLTEKPVSDAAEAAFAGLVEEISAKVQAGEDCDVEAYAHEHPRHAERLRRLLPAIEALAGIGLSLSGGESSQPAIKTTESVSGELGDFRIQREIGRGGMGVVYEAQQISLGRKVALKVLPFAAMLDQRQLARFQNEARAAASLKHPNIVHVYSVGCERGVHYYAMEYVDGQTLADVVDELRRASGAKPKQAVEEPPPTISQITRRLRSGTLGPDVLDRLPACPPGKAGKMPALHSPSAETKREVQARISTEGSHQSREYFRSVAELGVQAAGALEHAHQTGVVHRDIKPSNLMVDDEGHLWVTDFGLAMVETGPDLTMTGDILGTLRYMSPEQAEGGRRVLDHRTDVYSLGLTLYELLTLQAAFDGSGRQTLLRRISQDEPVPPRRLNSAIPADLETIVLKSIAKNPAERYATAGDLAEDLKRFLEDKPIRAKRPTLIKRAAKWSRRHQAVVWSAVVFLLLATTGLGVSNLLITWEKNAKDVALQDRDKALTEKQDALRLAEKRLAQPRLDFDRALKALDTVVEELSSAEFAQIPGVEKTRSEVLGRMLTLYEAIAEEHDDDPYARQQQALAYCRITEILELTGQQEEADEATNQGVSILEELLEENPDDKDHKSLLADLLFQRLHSLILTREERLKAAQRALALWEELVQPGSNEHIGWVGLLHFKVADLLPEDSPHIDEHIADSIRIPEEHGLTPHWASYIWLAQRAEKKGDSAVAEKNYRRGIEGCRSFAAGGASH